MELEDLQEEGPVQEVIELAAGSEGTNFQTPMPYALCCGRLEIFRCTAHTRQVGNVRVGTVLENLKKLKLVAFHHPQIKVTFLSDLFLL